MISKEAFILGARDFCKYAGIEGADRDSFINLLMAGDVATVARVAEHIKQAGMGDPTARRLDDSGLRAALSVLTGGLDPDEAARMDREAKKKVREKKEKASKKKKREGKLTELRKILGAKRREPELSEIDPISREVGRLAKSPQLTGAQGYRDISKLLRRLGGLKGQDENIRQLTEAMANVAYEMNPEYFDRRVARTEPWYNPGPHIWNDMIRAPYNWMAGDPQHAILEDPEKFPREAYAEAAGVASLAAYNQEDWDRYERISAGLYRHSGMKPAEIAAAASEDTAAARKARDAEVNARGLMAKGKVDEANALLRDTAPTRLSIYREGGKVPINTSLEDFVEAQPAMIARGDTVPPAEVAADTLASRGVSDVDPIDVDPSDPAGVDPSDPTKAPTVPTVPELSKEEKDKALADAPRLIGSVPLSDAEREIWLPQMEKAIRASADNPELMDKLVTALNQSVMEGGVTKLGPEEYVKLAPLLNQAEATAKKYGRFEAMGPLVMLRNMHETFPDPLSAYKNNPEAFNRSMEAVKKTALREVGVARANYRPPTKEPVSPEDALKKVHEGPEAKPFRDIGITSERAVAGQRGATHMGQISDRHRRLMKRHGRGMTDDQAANMTDAEIERRAAGDPNRAARWKNFRAVARRYVLDMGGKQTWPSEGTTTTGDSAVERAVDQGAGARRGRPPITGYANMLMKEFDPATGQFVEKVRAKMPTRARKPGFMRGSTEAYRDEQGRIIDPARSLEWSFGGPVPTDVAAAEVAKSKAPVTTDATDATDPRDGPAAKPDAVEPKPDAPAPKSDKPAPAPTPGSTTDPKSLAEIANWTDAQVADNLGMQQERERVRGILEHQADSGWPGVKTPWRDTPEYKERRSAENLKSMAEMANLTDAQVADKPELLAGRKRMREQLEYFKSIGYGGDIKTPWLIPAPAPKTPVVTKPPAKTHPAAVVADETTRPSGFKSIDEYNEWRESDVPDMGADTTGGVPTSPKPAIGTPVHTPTSSTMPMDTSPAGVAERRSAMTSGQPGMGTMAKGAPHTTTRLVDTPATRADLARSGAKRIIPPSGPGVEREKAELMRKAKTPVGMGKLFSATTPMEKAAAAGMYEFGSVTPGGEGGGPLRPFPQGSGTGSPGQFNFLDLNNLFDVSGGSARSTGAMPFTQGHLLETGRAGPHTSRLGRSAAEETAAWSNALESGTRERMPDEPESRLAGGRARLGEVIDEAAAADEERERRRQQELADLQAQFPYTNTMDMDKDEYNAWLDKRRQELYGPEVNLQELSPEEKEKYIEESTAKMRKHYQSLTGDEKTMGDVNPMNPDFWNQKPGPIDINPKVKDQNPALYRKLMAHNKLYENVDEEGYPKYPDTWPIVAQRGQRITPSLSPTDPYGHVISQMGYDERDPTDITQSGWFEAMTPDQRETLMNSRDWDAMVQDYKERAGKPQTFKQWSEDFADDPLGKEYVQRGQALAENTANLDERARMAMESANLNSDTARESWLEGRQRAMDTYNKTGVGSQYYGIQDMREADPEAYAALQKSKQGPQTAWQLVKGMTPEQRKAYDAIQAAPEFGDLKPGTSEYNQAYTKAQQDAAAKRYDYLRTLNQGEELKPMLDTERRAWGWETGAGRIGNIYYDPDTQTERTYRQALDPMKDVRSMKVHGDMTVGQALDANTIQDVNRGGVASVDPNAMMPSAVTRPGLTRLGSNRLSQKGQVIPGINTQAHLGGRTGGPNVTNTNPGGTTVNAGGTNPGGGTTTVANKTTTPSKGK